MTLCPVALAIGCKKCPIFSVCPVKTIIGDAKPPMAVPVNRSPSRPPAKPV